MIQSPCVIIQERKVNKMSSTPIKKTTIRSKVIIAFVMIILSFLLIFIKENTTFFNLGSPDYSNTPLVKDGFFFDTYISISIYDSKDNYSDNIRSKSDIEKLLDTCINMCKDYENIFSRTLETSELYKINHNTDFINSVTISVSDTLYDCITKTLEYSAIFGAKYSILSGSLCDIWDFDKAVVPDEETIKKNCISIESYDLIAKDNSLKLTNNSGITLPNPIINLGASAKGYIADKLCEYLKDNGISDAIIDLGGNIVVIGDKYDDSMYKIGIKKPFSEDTDPYAVCLVSDKAVVTSGIYERYFKEDGHIYHHIIDCSTGYPICNDILSVTIITDNSLQADCYSTGCLLIGKDDAMNLINNTEGVECIIIDDNYNIHLSQGLIYKNDYIVLK